MGFRAIPPDIEKDYRMNATISARILALVASGSTLDTAIDAVLGKGTFDGLVTALYEGMMG